MSFLSKRLRCKVPLAALAALALIAAPGLAPAQEPPPADPPAGGSGSGAPIPAPGFDEGWAGVRTIVIDPGHGGEEVGAISRSGLQEKELALDIARRLRRRLESKEGFRVLLTREDDRQVPLKQRTALANSARADLFVSIHLNSSRRTSAHGTEAYFLALTASDEEALDLARQENLAGPTGEGEETEGEAGEEGAGSANEDLQLVLWGMAQSEHLNTSSRLAELVQDEMDRLHGMESRGVKQAPFTVLMGATMPAILVEVAFLSNQGDEEKLARDDFRESAAQALETAIVHLKSETERAARPGPAAGSVP